MFKVDYLDTKVNYYFGVFFTKKFVKYRIINYNIYVF
ncbi:hypothetical protein CLTEP_04160 [Clostridium tepidiprofundi DSM 19306]|uniref:Uncharacterized protein n=1 Tax=Clostridium tepidiprofundi DSM 19306 TaxID=1121338 RepID=A0A151B8G5_9CLOT|nr:hypothetical protein CLTEP_04160 [Clostridium tepidiprofundi DSM 19306]